MCKFSARLMMQTGPFMLPVYAFLPLFSLCVWLPFSGFGLELSGTEVGPQKLYKATVTCASHACSNNQIHKQQYDPKWKQTPKKPQQHQARAETTSLKASFRQTHRASCFYSNLPAAEVREPSLSISLKGREITGIVSN